MKRVTKKASHNYGECHVCGSKMEPKVVSQEFHVKGRLVQIENVPAGVCTKCGAKVVTGQVGLVIDKLLHDSERLRNARTVLVPVLTFQEQAA